MHRFYQFELVLLLLDWLEVFNLLCKDNSKLEINILYIEVITYFHLNNPEFPFEDQGLEH